MLPPYSKQTSLNPFEEVIAAGMSGVMRIPNLAQLDNLNIANGAIDRAEAYTKICFD